MQPTIHTSTRRLSTGHEVVALIPAAGRGTRLAQIPGSKEVFPIGLRRDEHGRIRPKVVCEYLFERIVAAGVTRGIVVVRQGKWDIPAYLGEGSRVGMHLGYVVVDETLGPPDSLDRAHGFVSGQAVAFGFPDILLGPRDVYSRLLDRLDAGGADVVLALYEVRDPENSDTVELDEEEKVRRITLKDPGSSARYCWGCAVWTPAFTEYLHAFVGEARRSQQREEYEKLDASGDLPMGRVLQGALANGLRVAGVPFAGEQWTDLGTPEELARAAVRLRQPDAI